MVLNFITLKVEKYKKIRTMIDFNKEQYNKMCAEFLGAIYSEHAKAWGFGKACIEPNELVFGDRIITGAIWSERFERELNFDSDWNWIMEVVEKIENLGFDSLQGGSEYYYPEKGMRHIQSFIKDDLNIFSESKTKKKAVVQAIWKFLNWYKDETNK